MCQNYLMKEDMSLQILELNNSDKVFFKFNYIVKTKAIFLNINSNVGMKHEN